ncbi:MAG: hypothetical protein M3T49_07185 [Candidatus Eremiobacteraeota bacterium]|nr:hypothetical protein [Candidatus Eremiobacteraeota bacterium]
MTSTMMRSRRFRAFEAAAAAAALIAAGALMHRGNPAGAAPTTVVQLVDKALATVGPDDEGQYRLIDPIGPGGVTDAAADDEVLSSKLHGGNYGSTAGDRPIYR